MDAENLTKNICVFFRNSNFGNEDPSFKMIEKKVAPGNGPGVFSVGYIKPKSAKLVSFRVRIFSQIKRII